MNKLPFEVKDFKQVIIFIGIQASGKTAFYNKELSAHNYTHINLDKLKTRHQERLLLDDCIKLNKSFVVDNTNPTTIDRERYISITKSNGYEIIGIFFQSRIKDCIVRNTNRENSVPIPAICNTQDKLQMPHYEEGFDKLYFVRLSNNDFEIFDWKN